MIKVSAQRSIPTPEFLEVRSRNYFDMNIRSTIASYEYANKLDAQTKAGIIMVDIMERIADGNIGDVEGWQFKHHDNSSRGPLPNNIGFSIRRPAQATIRLAASDVAIQLRDSLADERQPNYRPDYVAITGPNAKKDPRSLDSRKHELHIRWVPEADGSSFIAELHVWSSLSEDKNTTPFFTLESLKAYVGLK